MPHLRRIPVLLDVIAAVFATGRAALPDATTFTAIAACAIAIAIAIATTATAASATAAAATAEPL